MKIDENTRRRVIRELQRHFRAYFRKVGPSLKYWTDSNGGRYVVLAGTDTWHEIPRSVFESEARTPGGTVLVVAIPDRNDLDIFVGPFRPLLEQQDRLSADDDSYVFHTHRFASRLVVRELPSLHLDQIERTAPESGPRTAQNVPDGLRRARNAAVARRKPATSQSTTRSRAAERVLAVEGNLIRADFRRKKPK